MLNIYFLGKNKSVFPVSKNIRVGSSDFFFCREQRQKLSSVTIYDTPTIYAVTGSRALIFYMCIPRIFMSTKITFYLVTITLLEVGVFISHVHFS